MCGSKKVLEPNRFQKSNLILVWFSLVQGGFLFLLLRIIGFDSFQHLKESI
jgi:hypothetical protein